MVLRKKRQEDTGQAKTAKIPAMLITWILAAHCYF